MAYEQETIDAVRRKLNITWDDVTTNARVTDVIEAVTVPLSIRCALPQEHTFSKSDPEWSLFLNACLYEFSDALDDFWVNYATELLEAHLRNFMANVPGVDDA